MHRRMFVVVHSCTHAHMSRATGTVRRKQVREEWCQYHSGAIPSVVSVFFDLCFCMPAEKLSAVLNSPYEALGNTGHSRCLSEVVANAAALQSLQLGSS